VALIRKPPPNVTTDDTVEFRGGKSSEKETKRATSHKVSFKLVVSNSI
jgi:hypothetical protein